MVTEKNEFYDTIKTHKEDINWILERQAELRAELMAFYKKDLKEIQSALISIATGSEGNNADDNFGKKCLEEVQTHFIDQWKRSYNLIGPSDDNNSSGQ